MLDQSQASPLIARRLCGSPAEISHTIPRQENQEPLHFEMVCYAAKLPDSFSTIAISS